MKYSVTMELHDAACLVRREIINFVFPPLVHCVLYYGRRSRSANPERKSLNLI